MATGAVSGTIPAGDDRDDARAIEVPLGDYRLAVGGDVLTAGMGASLCVCARDTQTGVGGISHFLLPAEEGSRNIWSVNAEARAMRLGNHAIEHLITDMQKRGGTRERLEVMVFGGALVHGDMYEVARGSVDVLQRYLVIEGIWPLCAELGGHEVREVVYVPATGSVRVTEAGADRARTILARELEEIRRWASSSDADDIVLF